ncbi:sigma-E factor negative regulatory protein [Variovorax dokdonensis]|uniref:Sigma-E factor negative regulatory protein n=1 Tax=Variovorax dokdonensis TaxID=344883 RepID=A0ABT7N6M3_9BURK|nr:sigma-E factor negative regulatory protein [Variovorax dokdonensis]MDM0043562.1 sigma-E factor negative regulatory protein [Variovorax dokdonensis]
MNNDDSTREQISALADGEIHANSAQAVARLVGQISSADELRQAWCTYHLIGDVLRTGAHTVCADSAEFTTRLRTRLTAEVVAPASSQGGVIEPKEAANEPVFRWKMLAGVASLAAVAAVAWNWTGVSSQGPASAQLAQQVPAASSPQLVPGARVLVGDGQRPQVMLRDPRLDALLEAHQQAGGASTMPSSFLRNATFEAPSR